MTPRVATMTPQAAEESDSRQHYPPKTCGNKSHENEWMQNNPSVIQPCPRAIHDRPAAFHSSLQDRGFICIMPCPRPVPIPSRSFEVYSCIYLLHTQATPATNIAALCDSAYPCIRRHTSQKGSCSEASPSLLADSSSDRISSSWPGATPSGKQPLSLHKWV